MVHSVYSDRDVFCANSFPMPPMLARNCAMRRSPTQRSRRTPSRSGLRSTRMPKPRHRGQWDRHVASRSHRSSRHDRAFGTRLSRPVGYGERGRRGRRGQARKTRSDRSVRIGFYSAFMVADASMFSRGARARMKPSIGVRTARVLFRLSVVEDEAPVRGRGSFSI